MGFFFSFLVRKRYFRGVESLRELVGLRDGRAVDVVRVLAEDKFAAGLAGAGFFFEYSAGNRPKF